MGTRRCKGAASPLKEPPWGKVGSNPAHVIVGSAANMAVESSVRIRPLPKSGVEYSREGHDPKTCDLADLKQPTNPKGEEKNEHR